MTLLPRPRRQDLSDATVPFTTPHVVTAALPPQSYVLRISDQGIVIEAADDQATFYANKTLDQLTVDGRVPVGAVEDGPDFLTRGVMLDISRDKVPTMATLELIVDRLASWKINQLQLYSEHTFAYRDHEEVWRDASPLDAEEIRHLDAYCKERHVELVPNQNCLGHWDRWLKHERYRPLSLTPDGWEERGRKRSPTTIDPTNPASLALIKDLLAELLPNFTSRRIHVGLDEPWELPKERIADYLAWAAALKKELPGRQMLIWGDILEGRHQDQLPPDVTVCEWWYEAEWGWDQRGGAHQRAGRDWWACPGTSSWQTILGRWDNALANIGNAVDAALAFDASGVLVTDWGDRGHLQQLPISWPGFAWTAAQTWCRASNRDLDLAAALDMGPLLRDLGNAYQAIVPQFPNMSTLVLHLYFPQLQVGRSFTEGITHGQVEAAEEVLARGAANAPEELLAPIELVQLLCRDLHARLQADGWLTSLPEKVRTELADDLAPLITRHRELWLARNRPGGLDDSAAWLENLQRCYRTGTVDKYWGGW